MIDARSEGTLMIYNRTRTLGFEFGLHWRFASSSQARTHPPLELLLFLLMTKRTANEAVLPLPNPRPQKRISPDKDASSQGVAGQIANTLYSFIWKAAAEAISSLPTTSEREFACFAGAFQLSERLLQVQKRNQHPQQAVQSHVLSSREMNLLPMTTVLKLELVPQRHLVHQFHPLHHHRRRRQQSSQPHLLLTNHPVSPSRPQPCLSTRHWHHPLRNHPPSCTPRSKYHFRLHRPDRKQGRPSRCAEILTPPVPLRELFKQT